MQKQNNVYTGAKYAGLPLLTNQNNKDFQLDLIESLSLAFKESVKVNYCSQVFRFELHNAGRIGTGILHNFTCGILGDFAKVCSGPQVYFVRQADSHVSIIILVNPDSHLKFEKVRDYICHHWNQQTLGHGHVVDPCKEKHYNSQLHNGCFFKHHDYKMMGRVFMWVSFVARLWQGELKEWGRS